MSGPDYDVVIVGAGASGSLIAAQLASSTNPKVDVLLLEAGPPRAPLEEHVDRFYAANAKVPSSPWPDSPQARRPSVLDIASKKDWRDPKHYMRQTGDVPFSSTYERIAGGTANHWLGTALRMLPEDFELETGVKVEGARDWPIGYDDLESYYCRAEEAIGVAGDGKAWDNYKRAHRSRDFPMPPIEQSYLDKQLGASVNGKAINGAEVQVIATPQARNSVWHQGRPPCVGNTSCVPICPTRAKYDPSNHLAVALGIEQKPTNHENPYPEPAANPAEISYRSVAYQVEVDASGKVAGIRYKEWDETGKVNDKRVTARIYVLCAHAIETAKLLLISPWAKPDGTQTTVANTSGQVGQNLMDHTVLLMWGLTRDPVYPFRGPLSTSGIGEYRVGGNRRERAAYIIEIGNEGWNWSEGAPFGTVVDIMNQAGKGQWYGANLRQSVHGNLTRQIRLGAEFESLPLAGSYVAPSKMLDSLGIPRPEIHYAISDYVKRGFDDAAKTLSAILRETGVAEVRHTVDPDSPGVFETPGGNTFQFRGAGRIMGTYRMGKSSADSVVDSTCRSHDHDNLFLAGSGVFPSTGTANPTLTLLALALRSADQITEDLK